MNWPIVKKDVKHNLFTLFEQVEDRFELPEIKENPTKIYFFVNVAGWFVSSIFALYDLKLIFTMYTDIQIKHRGKIHI